MAVFRVTTPEGAVDIVGDWVVTSSKGRLVIEGEVTRTEERFTFWGGKRIVRVTSIDTVAAFPPGRWLHVMRIN